MKADAFRAFALSLPEATQSSHLGATDFRVRGKIFAQPARDPGGWAIVKLTPEQQEVLCAAEPTLFKPEPGHWGRVGWTRFAMDTADDTTARETLWRAWRNVAPKALCRAHDQQVSIGTVIAEPDT